jgi:hypothetical protein
VSQSSYPEKIFTAPVVDKNGLLTRPWMTLFRNLLTGVNSPAGNFILRQATEPALEARVLGQTIWANTADPDNEVWQRWQMAEGSARWVAF